MTGKSWVVRRGRERIPTLIFLRWRWHSVRPGYAPRTPGFAQGSLRDRAPTFANLISGGRVLSVPRARPS
ncbi:hypothetical protein FRUB_07727 [Fimbriiglobus ruber]|uniref:Uncharacterized protein n=1 Tax=Fimbriiglobus ruber TaxID=1908690 RepID=A0A225DR42_9BACT|nr:hypothetical protein FRUB_07727 [Fimbriiglobus ruber]